MAVCSSETQSAQSTHLGAHATAVGPLDPIPQDPSPLARRALRRQDPRQEPSAVVPLARICAGGSPNPSRARAVPTAINDWANDELQGIAGTDDLRIAPLRADGSTYGTLTWIWSVVVDGALCVRAYNGKQSRWYPSALQQKAGRITAAGMMKEVSFERVEGSIQERIDEAYRAKYRASEYLAPMIGPRARSATVKVVPRSVPGQEKRS
jgi:hypothetical protein